MVISCGSCGARYRFKRSLLEGASGARIRCRRCGSSIEVREPESAERPQKQETDRSAGGRTEREAGIVSRPDSPPAEKSSEAVPLPAESAGVHGSAAKDTPDEEIKESPDAGSDRRAQAPEPVKSAAPQETAQPDAPHAFMPPPVPAAPSAGEILKATPAEGFAAMRNGFRRQKKSRALQVILGVCLLVLGIAAARAIMTSTDKSRSDKGPVRVEGERKTSQVQGAYAFERIETYFHRNRKDGSLFILKGLVAEKSGSPSKARILIHAQLLNTNNEVIAEKKVFAGISVSDEFLFSQEKETIDQLFSRTLDNAAAGDGSPPGTPIPFMVVFFDVPPGVGNFLLTAETGG